MNPVYSIDHIVVRVLAGRGRGMIATGVERGRIEDIDISLPK